MFTFPWVHLYLRYWYIFQKFALQIGFWIWKTPLAHYASGIEDFMESLWPFLISLVLTCILMPWWGSWRKYTLKGACCVHYVDMYLFFIFYYEHFKWVITEYASEEAILIEFLSWFFVRSQMLGKSKIYLNVGYLISLCSS